MSCIVTESDAYAMMDSIVLQCTPLWGGGGICIITPTTHRYAREENELNVHTLDTCMLS